jgi:solute:Na+ symporter, SSS family
MNCGTVELISTPLSLSLSQQVLYGTTEMGATPQLSWIAVIGYSSGSALPAILICWLGPKVRSMSDKAFSTTDFGRKRYGRVMQVTIACISGFYMFIFIVAELTAISGIFGVLTNNFSAKFGISVSLSVGFFTVLYTAMAGLPASIVTAKFQSVMMMALVIMLTLAVTTNPENAVTKSEFALASNWTLEGLNAAVTLIIAIACAELFNQSSWQRVWAAKSIPALRQGFAIGSIMVFFLMMFFGVMGMIAYANDPASYDSGEKYAYLSFFDLLEPLNEGWHILTLILVTALSASTVDSLQNGLSSIFFHDLVKIGWKTQWVCRCLMVVINIPATSVFPVFCGLQTEDIGMLKAPTELGAFLGCISGIVSVLVNGLINNAEGGIFEYFWLRNGGICTLCGTKTLISFIVTPLVSLSMTYIFSFLDVSIRGNRARQPLFHVAFDDDEATTDADVKKLEDSNDEMNDKEAGSGIVDEEADAAVNRSDYDLDVANA